MKNKYGYIYITTNLINNKKYVGQHKSKSFSPNKYIGSGDYFLKALKKYGKKNFKCELLEWCNSKETLNEREKYWISYYNAVEDSNFYNLKEGGSGEINFTESSLKRIVENNKGKHFKTKEQREQHSLKMKGFKAMLGKHMSEETKIKQSQSKKGKKTKPLTQEHKDKISKANKGRKVSQEIIEKRRNKILGHYVSERCKHNVSKAISKPVLCIETNQVYPSISSTHLSSVSNAIKYNKTAGGYHWRYLTEEEKSQMN